MTNGRNRVLDDVKRGEICALVTAGCSLRSVANYVGCDRGTIRRAEVRNPEFAEQLRRSELEGQEKGRQEKDRKRGHSTYLEN